MKRLVRSNTDKKLAGVAGGIAEYLNVDPTVIRVLFILTMLPGGIPGILLYVALWFVMPEPPTTNETTKEEE